MNQVCCGSTSVQIPAHQLSFKPVNYSISYIQAWGLHQITLHLGFSGWFRIFALCSCAFCLRRCFNHILFYHSLSSLLYQYEYYQYVPIILIIQYRCIVVITCIFYNTFSFGYRPTTFLPSWHQLRISTTRCAKKRPVATPCRSGPQGFLARKKPPEI